MTDNTRLNQNETIDAEPQEIEADRLEVERLVHAMNIEADDEDALTVLFYL